MPWIESVDTLLSIAGASSVVLTAASVGVAAKIYRGIMPRERKRQNMREATRIRLGSEGKMYFELEHEKDNSTTVTVHNVTPEWLVRVILGSQTPDAAFDLDKAVVNAAELVVDLLEADTDNGKPTSI